MQKYLFLSESHESVYRYTVAFSDERLIQLGNTMSIYDNILIPLKNILHISF